MDAAEVEKRHVKMDGSFQMIQRLAKSETQARKMPQVRPYAQIGPLDMAGRDVAGIRIPANRNGYRCRDLRWFVPVWPLTISGSVELHQLGEVHIGPEVFFNGRNRSRAIHRS